MAASAAAGGRQTRDQKSTMGTSVMSRVRPIHGHNGGEGAQVRSPAIAYSQLCDPGATCGRFGSSPTAP